MSDIFFAPLKVPLTDTRTGLMSREWYLFFQALFLRVGGSQGSSTDDLQLVADMDDATDDDSQSAAADLERAVSLTDEAPSTVAADIAELQGLFASIPEDTGGTVAAPTAKVGLTAVNGSAFTLMRSDAAPPIDQAITPTWSDLHKFSTGLQVSDGLVGTPSVAFVSETGLGLYRRAAGNMAAVVAGVDCASFTSTQFFAWLPVRTLSDGSTVTPQYSFNNETTIGLYRVGAGIVGISGKLQVSGNLGVNGTTPIAKPTVTGSRAANAALASLLTALANYGLITDSTTI